MQRISDGFVSFSSHISLVNGIHEFQTLHGSPNLPHPLQRGLLGLSPAFYKREIFNERRSEDLLIKQRIRDRAEQKCCEKKAGQPSEGLYQNGI